MVPTLGCAGPSRCTEPSVNQRRQPPKAPFWLIPTAHATVADAAEGKVLGIRRATNHARRVARPTLRPKFDVGWAKIERMTLFIGGVRRRAYENQTFNFCNQVMGCAFYSQAHKVWAKIRRRTADGNRGPHQHAPDCVALEKPSPTRTEQLMPCRNPCYKCVLPSSCALPDASANHRRQARPVETR